jgi:hypothetical protein
LTATKAPYFIPKMTLDIAGKKSVVGERWRKFFIDPSQWWDHRVGKVSTSISAGKGYRRLLVELLGP